MKQELNTLGEVFIQSLKMTLDKTTPESIDEILNSRDQPEFSSLWMKAYQAVEEMEMEEALRDQVDEIRKEIFLFTFRTANSSDLPAYISEDFELIASYYIYKIENPWVNHLFFTYLNHQIPHGELMKTDKTLKELVMSV
ncbi:hypothetical protein [Chryseobacterium indologenes]|uniref:Uncharacterized protein n=1 Tax=Chryseobacterium indologenes TaxID=253 RepID=A0A0N0IU81_CHRID|nr:hypothetical protein [Chryseobacterium indologenes]KPE49372.1 hypothetical protein AOB46_20550 [Chryseobacterium indologenes]